jgi:hypothetical protein
MVEIETWRPPKLKLQNPVGPASGLSTERRLAAARAVSNQDKTGSISLFGGPCIRTDDSAHRLFRPLARVLIKFGLFGNLSKAQARFAVKLYTGFRPSLPTLRLHSGETAFAHVPNDCIHCHRLQRREQYEAEKAQRLTAQQRLAQGPVALPCHIGDEQPLERRRSDRDCVEQVVFEFKGGVLKEKQIRDQVSGNQCEAGEQQARIVLRDQVDCSWTVIASLIGRLQCYLRSFHRRTANDGEQGE